MHEQYEQKAHRDRTANVIVAILLLLFLAFAVWLWLSSKGSGDDSTVEKAPALDVSVVRGLNGITLRNNESGTLIGCQVTINGDYSANVEMIDGQERTYPYASFTDGNSTRFDIVTTQPESLNIYKCQENPDRFAAYNW